MVMKILFLTEMWDPEYSKPEKISINNNLVDGSTNIMDNDTIINKYCKYPIIRMVSPLSIGQRIYIFESFPGIHESINSIQYYAAPRKKFNDLRLIRIKNRYPVWRNAFLTGNFGDIFVKKPICKDKNENRKVSIVRNKSLKFKKYLKEHT